MRESKAEVGSDSRKCVDESDTDTHSFRGGNHTKRYNLFNTKKFYEAIKQLQICFLASNKVLQLLSIRV